jgi:hypothetical protein
LREEWLRTPKHLHPYLKVALDTRHKETAAKVPA